MSSGRGGPGGGSQLLLDFPRIDVEQRPLIEAEPYRVALAALRRWKDWPGAQLALVGAPFSGRSRLLNWWAGQAGAAVVTGSALGQAAIEEVSRLSFSALAVDDADAASAKEGDEGMGLLAALNLCRDRGLPVLLAGAGEAIGWHSKPLDLVSRLRAMPVAAIGEPDDESLSLRLKEECARRHLILPEESVAYLALRMERSWAAIARVADQVERTKGRAETLHSARMVLTALGMSPDGEPEDGP